MYYLVKLIRKKLPQAGMIILYGSYARNEFVHRDERVEFGIPTVFMSDYDILVVTRGVPDSKASEILDSVEDKYYRDPEGQTPVEFINEDIRKLNRDLSEGRYFYTQVKKEGILLYDSGKFKLARRRKFRYDEIRKQAQEYFKEKYEKAGFFFDDSRANYEKGRYAMASFYLHQTCENLFHCTRLVYTLKSGKQHNLNKLLSSVRKYSDDFVRIFPRDTPEEKRLFKLLKSAYVEARYHPDFLVTKEDIDALMPKVERLFELVKRICGEKIGEYEKLADEK